MKVFSIGGKEPCLESLRKYLEKGKWVADLLEIWWDTQPVAEFLTLLPGGGIIPEGGSRQSLSHNFLCSIVSIQQFAAHSRRRSRQGLCYVKKELK